jgi:L-ascorbate metabolism protein UlaG (beta-lactamase superfamily)
MKFLKNDQLKTVKEDWPGNPYQNGAFQYLDKPFRPSWRKFLKWRFHKNPNDQAKKQDDWRPPTYPDASFLDSDRDFIAWLGHATFLLQIQGVRLITDPVLFDLPFIPRFVHPQFPVEAVKGIDYLLLSHDHRDHCDKKTIKALLRHNRPRKILTSLKMSDVIRSWANGTAIEEAAWYQIFDTSGEVEITFLPSRHWCRRGLTDFNRRLWGSFLIRTSKHTIYFGADSGYGDHFRETGERFPDMDLALLGIGAYRPAFMMEEIHTSPSQAVQAFKDLGARRMLPMHYGTYDLSDEPISEPYHQIQEIFKKEAMPGRLVLPKVGEPVWL